MVRDTPSSQDASTHQIWNSYLKEYRRYAPDTKRDGRTDGRTVRLLYASQSSFGGIKTFIFIIGKRYSLQMPGILKISFCRIPTSRNGFIDWLHGYYLCIFMLRTCTDRMADPILLPIFASNFAVFVFIQHALSLSIFYSKRISTKW